MKIAVIGTGYVGLVTGTCFAEMGNNVVCVDIDATKVKTLSQGTVTIFEPELDKLFHRNLKESRLHFTTSLEQGIKDAAVIFLALPTPPNGDGAADLTVVLSVAEHIGKLLTTYTVIVTKSTVPVGTCNKIQQAIQQHYKGVFDMVSNPEFLREGVAVDDFMNPDRIIIGTSSEKAKKIMHELYAPFVRKGNPIIYMDERSAELTKYAANAYLATKISFMNEIAQICEKLGANVDMVRKGLSPDTRIGRRFLFAGIGFGGSCFPKDVKALYKSAQEVDYNFKILGAVLQVNEQQKHFLIPKLLHHFKGTLQHKKIAIWGLAFKPNTDDIRDAPALTIIQALLAQGAQINAYDPEAMPNTQKLLGNAIQYGKDQYEVLDGADALIICTEWAAFRTPDFEKISILLKQKSIFDGRNVFDVEKMKELGFYYESVGRANTTSN